MSLNRFFYLAIVFSFTANKEFFWFFVYLLIWKRSHSVEIDLSKELRPPTKPVLEQQVEAARRGLSAAEVSSSCC